MAKIYTNKTDNLKRILLSPPLLPAENPTEILAHILTACLCPLSNQELNTKSSGPAPDGVTTCKINYLDLILHFYGTARHTQK